MLMFHVRLYPRIIVSNSHGNSTKYVDTVTIFQKLNQKVNDSKKTFDLTSIKVTCTTLPKDHCIHVPWKYFKVCGYNDTQKKKKNLNQRSLTPDDLWSQVCWGHLCDSTQGSVCPNPMKIRIHWLFFQTKGHWPLDDLWLHVYWGHVCNST